MADTEEELEEEEEEEEEDPAPDPEAEDGPVAVRSSLEPEAAERPLLLPLPKA